MNSISMFIINAPMLFSGIWAIVKPWVDKKTRKKVHIIGSHYQKELEKFIDIENIPDFLGGKADSEGKFPYASSPGPWNDFGKKKLFPTNDTEIVGLRVVFPPKPSKGKALKEEAKVESDEEYSRDLCEEEHQDKVDVKEMKTFFQRTCNWSFGLNKNSLTFKSNQPYSDYDLLS